MVHIDRSSVANNLFFLDSPHTSASMKMRRNHFEKPIGRKNPSQTARRFQQNARIVPWILAITICLVAKISESIHILSKTFLRLSSRICECRLLHVAAACQVKGKPQNLLSTEIATWIDHQTWNSWSFSIKNSGVLASPSIFRSHGLWEDAIRLPNVLPKCPQIVGRNMEDWTPGRHEICVAFSQGVNNHISWP